MCLSSCDLLILRGFLNCKEACNIVSIGFVVLCLSGRLCAVRCAGWSELIFLDFLGEMGCNLRA